MKYGAITKPIPPQLLERKETIKGIIESGDYDNAKDKIELKKGLEYNEFNFIYELRKVTRDIGLFISGSNGRYRNGKLPAKYRLKNMTAMRDQYTETVMGEFRKDLMKELEEAKTTEPLTQTEFHEELDKELTNSVKFVPNELVK